jgi:Ca2+-dependent lipid-binding protein
MDPYVVMKFSNQSYKGQVVKKGGTNPKFNDRCRFIVNSSYKHFGRCLELELMDSNITSDDIIGYGIVDLDPYLNSLKASAPAS